MENYPSAASLPPEPNLRLLACSRVGIHDIDILRFWLLNVIPQVDSVAVLIVSEEKDDYAQIEELCRAFGVKYRRHDITYFRDDQTIRSLEDWLREMPADWVIHTDCDELIAGDLREIAQRLEEGVDYAEGTMIDRLPADGKLRSLAGLETVADSMQTFSAPAMNQGSKNREPSALTQASPSQNRPNIGQADPTFSYSCGTL